MHTGSCCPNFLASAKEKARKVPGELIYLNHPVDEESCLERFFASGINSIEGKPADRYLER